MSLQDLKVSDTMHNIVLYFDANNPVVSANIRERLIQLAPQTAAKINQYLTRGRIILKRNADLATYQRAVDLWVGTGAVCRLEKVPAPTEAPIAEAENGANRPNPPHQIQTDEMVCPQCRRRQATAEECRYCGIIIRKIRARPLPQPPASTEETPSPRPASAGQWQNIMRRYNPIMTRVKNWLAQGSTEKSKAIRWSQRLIDSITRLAIAWGIALILEIGLLHLCNWMWFIYKSTPLGQHYLSMNNSQAVNFQYLFDLNLAMLGLEATLMAMIVCLVIGAAGRFCHFIRLFYEPFGFIAKMIFWTLPLTGVAGWRFHAQDPMIPLGLAWLICFLPTLALFGRSFDTIRILIPEMGTIVTAAGHWSGGFKSALDVLKEKLEKIIG